jgi:hypothetical protein
LAHTHDGVQNEDGEDDSGIDESCPPLAFFEEGQDEGDAGGGEEDDDKLILELF